jgi:hypothetical protein
MSNRPCNYCVFEGMKKLADQTGQTLILKPAPKFEIIGADEGVDVLIGGAWACWFMKLPKECAC